MCEDHEGKKRKLPRGEVARESGGGGEGDGGEGGGKAGGVGRGNYLSQQSCQIPIPFPTAAAPPPPCCAPWLTTAFSAFYFTTSPPDRLPTLLSLAVVYKCGWKVYIISYYFYAYLIVS